MQPSTRQGQLFRLLHAIEKAEVGHAHGFHQAVRRIFRISCTGAASWW